MKALEEHSISCPYCGESIEIIVSADEVSSEYIEDCQVCCRPIVIAVELNSKGGVTVFVRTENDTY
ncbi:CPXCG motif-containing cysteine-rich protein [Porticoccaceae bacterium LTM1]|nr:CPXCG motif-containing cysteine-rich protein [Porticoccaceae bacterium LTM1]